MGLASRRGVGRQVFLENGGRLAREVRARRRPKCPGIHLVSTIPAIRWEPHGPHRPCPKFTPPSPRYAGETRPTELGPRGPSFHPRVARGNW